MDKVHFIYLNAFKQACVLFRCKSCLKLILCNRWGQAHQKSALRICKYSIYHCGYSTFLSYVRQMRCQWGINECHVVKGEPGSAQSFINGYKASWVLWNFTNSATFFPTQLYSKWHSCCTTAVGQGSCAALLDEQMAAFGPNEQILLLHVTWFLRSKPVPSPVW